MTHAMQKVFDLINKTGDRCIVLSDRTDDAYIVMSLLEYERLALGRSEVVDLTENQLLDRINRDIAVWKSRQDDQNQNEMDIQANTANSDPYFNEFGENLANNRENNEENGYWDTFGMEDYDDDLEDDFEEEPFYFEKV